MRIPKQNIVRHLEQLPMLKALVPLIVGVVIADRITFPLWGVTVGFVLSSVAAWRWQRTRWADMLLCVMLLLLGMMASVVRRGAEPEHDSRLFRERVMCDIVVDRIGAQRGSTLMCDGRLMACRIESDAEQSDGETDKGHFIMRCPIRILADSSLGVEIGSRLVAACRIKAYEMGSQTAFESYMARRGVMGQLRVDTDNVVSHSKQGVGLTRWLHRVALERLHRLPLSESEAAVVDAMTIGERSRISSSLRQEYARSGAAHLLAVSGLHVGFVFAVINIFLWWITLFRHGQLFRVVPAVAAIWIYAAVAGASPSVVRAAVMFSLLQLILTLSARRHALNSLAFTAMVMLVWNSHILYDAGFLLSFSAVAGIVVWGAPLNSLCRVKVPIVRRLWRAVAMSFAASVATMPLTAYMFGVVSLWSVVLGPLMILLGMVVVSVAMVWLLLPIGFMTGIVASLLNTFAGAMNQLSAWCSQSGWLIVEGHMSGPMCALCYVVMVAMTLAMWSFRDGDYSSKSISSSSR